MGSGIRTVAVSRGGGALKRLKSGQEKLGKEKPLRKEKLWKFARERRLKLGKLKLGNAKRLKFGKALAVTAPTMARAANDTMIAGTRLEGPCGGASGDLLSCVALSGASATCVPYVSAQSQAFPPPSKKIKKAVAWTIQRRLAR